VQRVLDQPQAHLSRCHGAPREAPIVAGMARDASGDAAAPIYFGGQPTVTLPPSSTTGRLMRAGLAISTPASPAFAFALSASDSARQVVDLALTSRSAPTAFSHCGTFVFRSVSARMSTKPASGRSFIAFRQVS